MAMNATRTPYIQSYKRALALLLEEHRRDEARTMMVHVTLPLLVLYHDAWNAFVQSKAAELEQAVRQSNVEVADGQQRFLLVLLVAGLLTVGIAVFATSRTEREMADRQRAEQALHRYHEQLEQQVQERSAQLTSEIAERQAIDSRYRTLFESSSDAVMTLDAARFLDCNPATLKMFGYATVEAFTALHPADVSPSHQPSGLDSRTAADQRIAEALARGTNRFEWTHRRRDGADFPAEVWLTAFQMGGRRILQATVRDITQRRALEGQLRRRQRFETVGALASGMAHEINNPINGIVNYAQLVLDGAPCERAGEYAAEIIREATRIATLIQRLQVFTEQSEQTHSPKRLSDLLANVLAILEDALRQEQIALRIDVPEDLPLIDCHGTHIQQVFLSLLANGREALIEKYPGGDSDKVLAVTAESDRTGGRIPAARDGRGPRHRHPRGHRGTDMGPVLYHEVPQRTLRTWPRREPGHRAGPRRAVDRYEPAGPVHPLHF